MAPEQGEVPTRPTPNPTPNYTWAYELQWYRRHFNCLLHVLLGGPLVIVFLAGPYVSCCRNTAIMTITSAILGGLGITIGYHRLWAHRSFQACTAVKILLAVAGAAQSQWPILWWVRHHRAHHKYVDTDRDPYNANRGLWFTHIGWLLGKNEAAWGRVDVSDLEIDPVVIWQKRLYYPIVVVVGILLPTAVAHYGWNDWKGGMIYGGLGRIALSHHVTFMINSVAHASWAGSQPYSATTTARNVPLLALVSFGEGNHNFHHTFPTDYRNGIKWHEPDLSRLVIWTWAKLGLVSDLKTVSPLEIELAGQRQHVRRTEDGEKLTQLPRMIWHEYIKQVNRGRCWVSIDGMVYDVTDYMNDHPGGRDLIEGVIGKDATALYYGHHSHSPHAAAVLEDLRISLIRSD